MCAIPYFKLLFFIPIPNFVRFDYGDPTPRCVHFRLQTREEYSFLFLKCKKAAVFSSNKTQNVPPKRINETQRTNRFPRHCDLLHNSFMKKRDRKRVRIFYNRPRVTDKSDNVPRNTHRATNIFCMVKESWAY